MWGGRRCVGCAIVFLDWYCVSNGSFGEYGLLGWKRRGEMGYFTVLSERGGAEGSCCGEVRWLERG